jgi:phosphate transport system protein
MIVMNLSAHTLKSYDEQLKHLSDLIAQMVGELRNLVRASKEAFRSRDEARIADAKAADKIINRLDQEIEEAAITVLALQSPVAVDLRFVTSVLKITSMLEQAGDMAKNTVKRSVRMGTYASESGISRLERMADVIDELLSDALKAFQTRDADLATKVWKRDDEVDDIYKELITLMQEEMAQSKDRIAPCTHVMFAAKNLERLADYTTNLAKTVYYINTGKRADKSILKD